jgi:ligand-binding SRPBCC domain-containing protein
MMYTLTCELLSPTSIKETFSIFENPYNLAKITPPELGFKVLTKEQVVIRKGTEIEYRIYWQGLPMHWRTLITEYDPPFFFEDVQAKGPYTLWRHRHTF